MADGVATQDAYVFVDSGSQKAIDALDALWRDGTIRYAVRLVSGGYGAVAFLEVALGDEGLRDLRERISAIRDRVNPGVSVGLAAAIGPRAPSRWSTKPPVGAYVRIRAEAGAAMDVFRAVNELHPGRYMGSALVIGDWDVLLEIGAQSLEELKATLIDEVVPIPGVLWTDTCVALSEVVESRGPVA
jgi:DNA-binding Lrp family transcriptional regulator